MPSTASCAPRATSVGTASARRSSPFCHAIRLTTANSNRSDVLHKTEALLKRALVRLSCQTLQRRIAMRSADRFRDSRYRCRCRCESRTAPPTRRAAVHRGRSRCLRLDFLCVSRGHGRYTIGKLQTSLEKADLPITFDAVDRERVRRKPQPLQQIGRKLPLKGKIVDCQHGRRPPPARHRRGRPSRDRPANHGHE